MISNTSGEASRMLRSVTSRTAQQLSDIEITVFLFLWSCLCGLHCCHFSRSIRALVVHPCTLLLLIAMHQPAFCYHPI